MKKILFLLLICYCSAIVAQQPPAQKKATAPAAATGNKYKDNVDDRMKGPKGEKIYIGTNGGRYYLKNGKKVYVPYKGTKKKKQ